jgi:predicted MFS family arabinose efflux permease
METEHNELLEARKSSLLRQPETTCMRWLQLLSAMIQMTLAITAW